MSTELQPDMTGVILVGGKSRRMGLDKAFLPWHGAPLFERMLALFRQEFGKVLLVGGEGSRFAGYEICFVADIFPGSALGGLYTGLFHASDSHVFVASCDMPFPSAELLRYLCSLKDGYDCVVPETALALEPLFAVYSKNALPAMLQLLASGNLRVYDLYPMLKTRYVRAGELAPFLQEGKPLLNVNTPEEFAALQEE